MSAADAKTVADRFARASHRTELEVAIRLLAENLQRVAEVVGHTVTLLDDDVATVVDVRELVRDCLDILDAMGPAME